MSSELLSKTTVVVPFRLASQRFPQKALSRVLGKTLIEHALVNAAALEALEVVVSAPPEDLRAAADVVEFGSARLVPSSPSARSATERIVEIQSALGGELVLSLPVDEPALDPREIRRALQPGISAFGSSGALTFYTPFFAEPDFLSPLSAKVVVDRRGMLLYMSRGLIPAKKQGTPERNVLKKNVGAFLFQRSFLRALEESRDVSTTLDECEGLEQLRWLELGLAVRCLEIRHIGFGIDVPEQVQELEERLSCR